MSDSKPGDGNMPVEPDQNAKVFEANERIAPIVERVEVPINDNG